MDLAYAAADVIISRAGAISVSELCLVGKPMILVPSPNVTEDHQTHNAMALVNRVAALLVKDSEAREVLVKTALKLIEDKALQDELSLNCKSMAMPHATAEIVNEIEKCLK
jgi:UDP-N-acetylglucosamine--N-acetylmuramyl-(pentapeptide) pyrophosphoryl-undecaprenol N-acetylglucosamine transferase